MRASKAGAGREKVHPTKLPNIEALPSASGARRRSYTRGSEVGDRYRPSLKTITITIKINEFIHTPRENKRLSRTALSFSMSAPTEAAAVYRTSVQTRCAFRHRTPPRLYALMDAPSSYAEIGDGVPDCENAPASVLDSTCPRDPPQAQGSRHVPTPCPHHVCSAQTPCAQRAEQQLRSEPAHVLHTQQQHSTNIPTPVRGCTALRSRSPAATAHTLLS